MKDTKAVPKKAFNSNDFRKELGRIMPWYKWTVHGASEPKKYIDATGIQSSGFNRLSTLHVARREKNGIKSYTVKSSGFGLRSPWLHECSDITLASALRKLQNHYEAVAAKYGSHAAYLRSGRKPVESEPEDDGQQPRNPKGPCSADCDSCPIYEDCVVM